MSASRTARVVAHFRGLASERDARRVTACEGVVDPLQHLLGDAALGAMT